MKELDEAKLIEEVKKAWYQERFNFNNKLKKLNLEIDSLTSKINFLVNRQKNEMSEQEAEFFKENETKFRLKRLELKEELKKLENEG